MDRSLVQMKYLSESCLAIRPRVPRRVSCYRRLPGLAARFVYGLMRCTPEPATAAGVSCCDVVGRNVMGRGMAA